MIDLVFFVFGSFKSVFSITSGFSVEADVMVLIFTDFSGG